MFNFSIQELAGSFWEALFGAVLTILVYMVRRVYEHIKTRNVRRFWRSFIGDSLSIILTEYAPAGDKRFKRLQEITGNRWLMSEGMAFSLARLLDFCKDHVTKRKDIIVFGDKSGGQTTDNVILLGSPAVNRFSASMYEHVASIYEMPYKIIWDEDAVNIELVAGDTKLTPEFKDGIGQDFALVVKCCYQKVPQKWVVMIFGCHMWGTQAGTTAATDLRILSAVTECTDGASNVVFIIKTRVVNNTPTGPELDIKHRRFVQALKPKVGV